MTTPDVKQVLAAADTLHDFDGNRCPQLNDNIENMPDNIQTVLKQIKGRTDGRDFEEKTMFYLADRREDGYKYAFASFNLVKHPKEIEGNSIDKKFVVNIDKYRIPYKHYVRDVLMALYPAGVGFHVDCIKLYFYDVSTIDRHEGVADFHQKVLKYNTIAAEWDKASKDASTSYPMLLTDQKEINIDEMYMSDDIHKFNAKFVVKPDKTNVIELALVNNGNVISSVEMDMKYLTETTVHNSVKDLCSYIQGMSESNTDAFYSFVRSAKLYFKDDPKAFRHFIYNIKRSLDYGQVYMIKNINDNQVAGFPKSHFLVTFDKLCYMKALMEGTPVMFQKIMGSGAYQLYVDRGEADTANDTELLKHATQVLLQAYKEYNNVKDDSSDNENAVSTPDMFNTINNVAITWTQNLPENAVSTPDIDQETPQTLKDFNIQIAKKLNTYCDDASELRAKLNELINVTDPNSTKTTLIIKSILRTCNYIKKLASNRHILRKLFTAVDIENIENAGDEVLSEFYGLLNHYTGIGLSVALHDVNRSNPGEDADAFLHGSSLEVKSEYNVKYILNPRVYPAELLLTLLDYTLKKRIEALHDQANSEEQMDYMEEAITEDQIKKFTTYFTSFNNDYKLSFEMFTFQQLLDSVPPPRLQRSASLGITYTPSTLQLHSLSKQEAIIEEKRCYVAAVNYLENIPLMVTKKTGFVYMNDKVLVKIVKLAKLPKKILTAYQGLRNIASGISSTGKLLSASEASKYFKIKMSGVSEFQDKIYKLITLLKAKIASCESSLKRIDTQIRKDNRKRINNLKSFMRVIRDTLGQDLHSELVSAFRLYHINEYIDSADEGLKMFEPTQFRQRGGTGEKRQLSNNESSRRLKPWATGTTTNPTQGQQPSNGNTEQRQQPSNDSTGQMPGSPSGQQPSNGNTEQRQQPSNGSTGQMPGSPSGQQSSKGSNHEEVTSIEYIEPDDNDYSEAITIFTDLINEIYDALSATPSTKIRKNIEAKIDESYFSKEFDTVLTDPDMIDPKMVRKMLMDATCKNMGFPNVEDITTEKIDKINQFYIKLGNNDPVIQMYRDFSIAKLDALNQWFNSPNDPMINLTQQSPGSPGSPLSQPGGNSKQSFLQDSMQNAANKGMRHIVSLFQQKHARKKSAIQGANQYYKPNPRVAAALMRRTLIAVIHRCSQNKAKSRRKSQK